MRAPLFWERLRDLARSNPPLNDDMGPISPQPACTIDVAHRAESLIRVWPLTGETRSILSCHVCQKTVFVDFGGVETALSELRHASGAVHVNAVDAARGNA